MKKMYMIIPMSNYIEIESSGEDASDEDVEDIPSERDFSD